MHEYKRFIQDELDARGWRQADLVRKSGLSRQLISNILRDDRDYLGQMPDATTLEGLARGLGVPVDRVRVAAARSIMDYEDGGEALNVTLGDVSTDALLNEIRKRITHASQPADTATPPTAQPGASGAEVEKTGPVTSDVLPASRDDDETDKPTSLSDRRSRRQAGRDFTADPIIEADWAADDRGPDDEGENERKRRHQDEAGEEPQE